METLKDLLAEQLKDIYYAENQMVDAIPKMAKAASSSELRETFEKHFAETKEHIKRLEKVFDLLDLKVEKKECEAIKGIIKEGEELIKKKDNIDPDVLDAGLIASAQRAEHYEIAVYGTMRRFAIRIGNEEAADLLEKTLDEEYHADRKLTRVAQDTVNKEAVK